MVQSKYIRPVGWRKESHRHYLAAKGIKTKKYNSSKENLSFSEFVHSVEGIHKEANAPRSCAACGKPAYMAHKESLCAECKNKIYLAHPDHDRFYSFKDSVKAALKDERPFYHEHKMESMGVDLRQRDVDYMQNEVVGKLDSQLRQGLITGDNRERFMKNEFRVASEDYINGRTSKDQYDDEVRRKLANHMQLHNRTASAFDWVKEEKAAEVQK